MPDRRADIARTIARLDHPDAIHQDEILATLSAGGQEAREVALSSLGLISPRVHRALLRWLSSRIDTGAALPLMRYVFDMATVIEEQSGRTLAMSMLVRLVEDHAEEDSALRGRARAFAEDLLEDRDPEVVKGALRILRRVGNGRSALQLENLRESLEETNASELRATLDALSDLPLHGDQGQSSAAFAENLIASAGPRRRVLVREWRRRPDQVEVARAILTRDEGPVDQALQILIASSEDGHRDILQRHLQSRESERFTLALQAVAACASPPSRSVELEAVRRALTHPEALVRRGGAALAAAVAPDDAQVERALLGMLLEQDPGINEVAARALSHLPGHFDTASLARITRAADVGVQRLQHTHADEAAMALAWTLRAAARRLPDNSAPDTHTELRALAIVTLNLPGQHRPLEVASLELLDRLSARALDAWPEDQLTGLITLASGEDAKSASRAAEILIRVAPAGLTALDAAGANELLDPVQHTIPLLFRSASETAYQRLLALSEDDDLHISRAAHDALATIRRRRNDADFIEAHFIPRSGDD
ncbi:hypothetical protein FRC98_08385 [Lujinxingia vulgaris]|uniref:HEAT repeat domain-containing protein n=1 Tax=Lujinxingia vulgaris TaxID=2600176 RepID=A0A5C6XK62_9DELT|nr:hypothetical protein [Lujinxingia vulgaris]TXD37696.1 hypothetical protein FRC98_08385 [Lujinxingia vulgaris]